MENLNVAREKTVITVRTPDEPDTIPKRVTLRSNRLIAQRVGDKNDKSVLCVRCRSLTSAMRCAMQIRQVQSQHGTYWTQNAIEIWSKGWEAYMANQKAMGLTADWIAVYRNGERLFSNMGEDYYDLIEKIAKADPVTNKVVKKFTDKYFKKQDGQEIEIEHDSMPSFFLEEKESLVKARILNRKTGSKDQLSFTIEQDEDGAYALAALDIGAKIMDLHNKLEEFNVMRHKLLESDDTDYIRNRTMKNTNRDDLLNLKRQIVAAADNLEIDFVPALPAFNIPL